MPDIPTVTQAAHVLVDVVSTYDRDGDPEQWQAPIDASVPRLVDIGAVEVTAGEQPGDVELGLYDLVLAAALTLDYLAVELAKARGVDRDDVILELREWIDQVAD